MTESLGSVTGPPIRHVDKRQGLPDRIEGFIRSTKLCERCLQIFDPSRPRKSLEQVRCKRDLYELHESVASLLVSAKSGCKVCVHLHEQWTRGSTVLQQDESFFFDKMDDHLVLGVRNPDSNDCTVLSRVNLEALSGLRSCTVPAPTSSLFHTLSTIQKWKAICSTSHRRCKQRSGDSSQPTRLLLLNYEDNLVRLIHVDADQSIKYVTLSHRWGAPDPPKLSCKDEYLEGRIPIRKLECGVPISSLPQTFRDAVLIVVRCGLRHLWIDSLCILQDKTTDNQNEDWNREAVKVGGIYANAVFNIAATDSQNSDGGLFPQEQDILLPIVRDLSINSVIHLENPDTTPEAEDFVKILRWTGDFDFQKDIMNSELLSRGWVYQEVILARANLFCSRKQMWWSCNSNIFSQVFPRGGILPGSREKSGSEWDALIFTSRPVSLPGAHEHPTDAWIRVLEHYTKTSVTYDDDRLAAIGGLAEVFRTIFPLVLEKALYHSGLWFHSQNGMSLLPATRHPNGSHDDIFQLYWHGHPDDDKVPAGRRTSLCYPIPSWSPLSFDGPTRYVTPSPGSRIVPQFVGIHGDPDSFGRAKGSNRSWIHIRGVHVPFPIHPETLQYLSDWDVSTKAKSFKVIWDDLEDARWIPSRTSMVMSDLPSYTIRALPIEFMNVPQRVAGIILRPFNITEDLMTPLASHSWVRCGFFSTMLERSEAPWHAYLEYFGLHDLDLSLRPRKLVERENLSNWHFLEPGDRGGEDMYMF